jgi:hypothetical protein
MLDDDLEVSAAISRTLGLATNCWRSLPIESHKSKSIADPRQLRSYLESGPLQLRLFRHAGLTNTRPEVAFFKFRKKEFDLLGPIPEEDQAGELALAEHLANPRRPYNGRIPRMADQVVHIACHHQLSEDRALDDIRSIPFLDSIIKLGEEEHLWVRTRDLDNKLARLAVQATKRQVEPKPLVFFNACRGQFHPHAATSIVKILLDNGSRGVISTIVSVPDRVAATFSRLFYEQLLEGDTVPEALRVAKISLFERTGSPLGMLYTYTGEPDLRISAPRQRVT